MLQPDRLDRFFPITYPNGATVSRFAKPCPHCKQLVKASAMDGVALLLQDKVFVLAQADCPQCRHAFVVKCVINADKQVFPVQLPLWLYRIVLHWGARKQLKVFRQQHAWRVAQQDIDALPPAASGQQLPDSAMVRKSDEIVGRFQDHAIHAWIESDGRRFVYDRAVPAGGHFSLDEHELLFDGRLIYRPA